MAKTSPIGIFDSGIGGLSIAKQISKLLPEERQMYFADSEYAPYGDKSPALLSQRANSICEALIERGCKLIVIACNSATVNSVAKLRNKYPIPFVGVEPGIKPAITSTKSDKVAILATEATLRSQSFRRLVDIHKKQKQVFLQPCPGLAELIEEKEIDSVECVKMLKSYIDPLVLAGVDTIALGCTHYPFVKANIASLYGDKVTLIDTSIAVAKQVQRLLSEQDLLANRKQKQDVVFFKDACPEKVKKIHTLWHQNAIISAININE